MKTILNYIDTMFAGVPVTADTNRLREDITANMTDKFDELIKDGKSNNEAVGTVISEFGNIDEVLAEMGIERVGSKEKKPFSPVNAYVGRNLPALILRPLAAVCLMFVIMHLFSTNSFLCMMRAGEIDVIMICAAAAFFCISVILRTRVESRRTDPDAEVVAALGKHREKNVKISSIAGMIFAAATAIMLLSTYFLQLPYVWETFVGLMSVLSALYFVFDCAMRNGRALTDIAAGKTPERSTVVQCVRRLGMPCIMIAVSTHWNNLMNLDGDEETMIFMLKFVPYVVAGYVTVICIAHIIDSLLPMLTKRKEA